MQKFAMSEERMFMIVINEAPCLTIGDAANLLI